MKKLLIKYTKTFLTIALFETGILKLIRWIRIDILKRPRLTILCYHRITDKKFLLAPQCISENQFEQQLKFFTKHYDIWALDKVAKFINGEIKLVKDTLCFTFDDGYLDNYTSANNLLLKYNCTATFFISSNPLLFGEQYWLDYLSQTLPKFDKNTVYSLNNLPLELLQLFIDFIDTNNSEKPVIARKIFQYLNKLTEQQKHNILDNIKTLLPVTSDKDTEVMSITNAKEMQNNGHIIAAHSINHPRFSNLTHEELKLQITESINQLRKNDIQVNYFAYPFGKASDIGHQLDFIENLLKETNIELAFTTIDGCVNANDKRYYIPRKVMSPQTISQINLKLELHAWK